jgi:hypothetical protein
VFWQTGVVPVIDGCGVDVTATFNVADVAEQFALFVSVTKSVRLTELSVLFENVTVTDAFVVGPIAETPAPKLQLYVEPALLAVE